MVLDRRPDTEPELALMTSILGWTEGISLTLAVLVTALLLFWWAA
jgi:hypothetical protein